MTLLNESEYLITDKDVDPTFKDEIMANGSESLAICYQCGHVQEHVLLVEELLT